MFLPLILALCNLINYTYCAKILGVFFVPVQSHQNVFGPFYRELSLRGHQVTVITPFPFKDETLTNLTEIEIRYPREIGLPKSMNTPSFTDFFKAALRFCLELTDFLMLDKRIQKLCTDEETKFDLVLVEALMPFYYAFGAKCNAPTIGIVSLDAVPSSHSNIGNVVHPLFCPNNKIGGRTDVKITEKLLHLYYTIWFKWFYRSRILPVSEGLKTKYFGLNLQPVEAMERNSSMLYINTNLVLHYPQPLVPSTIQLSFMHIKTENFLPLDLQTILDNGTRGVVYFSLGSNVRSSELPAPTIKLIKEALSEVPYTVLWKWETDNVPDVGSNVITRKWFPQQDVLAHKNLKAFVTQGGLQSTEEAINYGVPMVGIPFLGDQEMNVKQSMKQGISLYLDHRTMTKEELKKSIVEIMENPKYFKRIQELKEIAQDQPMTGLERAVWWSEYVIRHKGAKHLRSPVADMPVWEYLMLDVVAVVLGALILIIFVLYKTLRFLVRMLFAKFKKVKQA